MIEVLPAISFALLLGPNIIISFFFPYLTRESYYSSRILLLLDTQKVFQQIYHLHALWADTSGCHQHKNDMKCYIS